KRNKTSVEICNVGLFASVGVVEKSVGVDGAVCVCIAVAVETVRAVRDKTVERALRVVAFDGVLVGDTCLTVNTIAPGEIAAPAIRSAVAAHADSAGDRVAYAVDAVGIRTSLSKYCRAARVIDVQFVARRRTDAEAGGIQLHICRGAADVLKYVSSISII